jgi:hypothetical protein
MSVEKGFQLFFPWILRENGSIIHHRDKSRHLPFQNVVISLYAVTRSHLVQLVEGSRRHD